MKLPWHPHFQTWHNSIECQTHQDHLSVKHKENCICIMYAWHLKTMARLTVMNLVFKNVTLNFYIINTQLQTLYLPLIQPCPPTKAHGCEETGNSILLCQWSVTCPNTLLLFHSRGFRTGTPHLSQKAAKSEYSLAQYFLVPGSVGGIY